jgi:hypothetical protein
METLAPYWPLLPELSKKEMNVRTSFGLERAMVFTQKMSPSLCFRTIRECCPNFGEVGLVDTGYGDKLVSLTVGHVGYPTHPSTATAAS